MKQEALLLQGHGRKSLRITACHANEDYPTIFPKKLEDLFIVLESLF